MFRTGTPERLSVPLEKQATIVHEMNRRFAKPDVPKGLSLTPSGLAVVGVGLLENLESNRVLLTYLAISFVAAFLAIRLRSVVRSLLSLVPVLIAVGLSSLVAYLFDLKLSPLTAVGGPLVVAICTEFTSLILLRFVEERGRGFAPREAVDHTAARTGRAFIVSGLTAVSGVAVIATSSMPLLRDFGIVVGMNVLIALLSALVFLPPMLVWADSGGRNWVSRHLVPADVLAANGDDAEPSGVPTAAHMTLWEAGDPAVEGPDRDAAAEPLDATWTVAEVGTAVAGGLRATFPDEIWLRGEIRSLRAPNRSGHRYFDLVEPGAAPGEQPSAKVSVALFRGAKERVNAVLADAPGQTRIADGVEVRIRGRVDWWVAGGQLRLVMSAIDPVFTLGRLDEQRRLLLEVLVAEGLLRRNATLVVPTLSLRIGLVTSAGSAAHADFVHELTASGYAFEVVLADARVQGVDAPSSVVAAIARVASMGVDVIAVVRGGGATTDLAAFDHEDIARAIALAPVPVFTGIGHEIDRNVAGEVAHTDFKTPTATAAALVARIAEVEQSLGACRGPRRPVGRPPDGRGERADRWAHATDRAGGTGGRLARRRAPRRGARPAVWPPRQVVSSASPVSSNVAGSVGARRTAPPSARRRTLGSDRGLGQRLRPGAGARPWLVAHQDPRRQPRARSVGGRHRRHVDHHARRRAGHQYRRTRRSRFPVAGCHPSTSS